ncbi:MAG: hypothetical protein ABIS14_09135 [Sphingomonas sp.]
MHEVGWIVPVGVVSVIAARQVFTTWIRARHGYPLERNRLDRAMGNRTDDLDGDRKMTLLTNENERLHGQVSRLEERIAVLERIATDPAERTAREIDALRD